MLANTHLNFFLFCKRDRTEDRNSLLLRSFFGSFQILSAALSLVLAATTLYAAESPLSATPPIVPPNMPSSDAMSQYVIGPGDVLQVFVWRNPELSISVPVRPDGKISTPLVEDMIAVGKTPTQLQHDIEGRLVEYIRSPQVSIIVTSAVGAFSQIKVVGQVKSPQSVSFHEGMTVLDVVLATGGLTDYAAGNRARLLRKDEHGKEQTIKLKLEDLMRKGKISQNVPMKPGDVLVVPEALF